MSSLVHDVASRIRQRRLFKAGQPILVAVSGGVDSMVLLRVLHQLAPRNGWRLTVAHFNHQLRGRASDADERLVRRVAAQLGLPCVTGRADVRHLARAQQISVEMAARQARHQFLAAAALKRRIYSIALAHHADDQVELFFLRLLRGSGSDGLAGMKWRNDSPERPGIQLVRPLLDVPKSVLCQFASDHKTPFRQDASNARLEIQRNRIRHELLPLLRLDFQPALEKTVLRVMDVLGAEAEYLANAAWDWRRDARSRRERVSRLKTGRSGAKTAKNSRGAGTAPPFGELPVALQRKCLQLELLEQGIRPDFDLIEKLRLRPNTPVTVSAPTTSTSDHGGHRLASAPACGECCADDTAADSDHSKPLRLTRDASGRVHRQPVGQQGFSDQQLVLHLKGKSGAATFSDVRINWRLVPEKTAPRMGSRVGQEAFDADKVGSPILLRHWQPGDRFQPIGMKRPVKLQDFFTNEKIPRYRRHELIVGVTCKGEVCWVQDMRIGERFKLDKQTIRRLQWRWKGL